MAELKSCPFCGGQPEIIDNSGECYFKNNAKSRLWKMFLRREARPVGSRGKIVDYYVFMVNDYQIHCSTTGCFARNLNKHFHSRDEAIEAWNRRTTIETNIYDKEETYPNCTVQVLTNTVTGDVSVGWWKNGGAEDGT